MNRNSTKHDDLARGSQPSITEAIKQLVREWKVHPYDINQGECGEFAYQLAARFHGAWHILCDDHLELFGIADVDPNGHNMIEYQGRYYDAECPEGVEYPEFLPIFLRQWAPNARNQLPKWTRKDDG